jgi:hypothetical protein
MLETGYLSRSGGENPTGQTTLLYQLEYPMKTPTKSRFARPPAAAAVLAFWLMIGGAQAVRAEDSDILSPPGQDIVLVSAKTVNELEQRILFLEETVEALTVSWQHINTHRLCVSDDSGAETCVSKRQLDALLIQLAEAKGGEAAVSQEAAVAPPAKPVETAATADPSAEPTIAWTPDPRTEPIAAPSIVVGENLPSAQEPEVTGTVTPDDASAGPSTGAAVLAYPKVEIYEEPTAPSDN